MSEQDVERSTAPSSLSVTRQLTERVSRDILRASILPEVLAGFGRVLKNLKLSDGEDPQEVFDLSHEVDRIDDFLSHDWETPRWLKFLSLVAVYNFSPAVILSVLAASLIAALDLAGLSVSTMTVPRIADADAAALVQEVNLLIMVVPPLVFLAVLFFWQRFKQVLRFPLPRIFLDKVCVHQSNVEMKTRAILSFAGFLDHTDRLVILWTPRYLTRLWCVYEVASWAHLDKDFGRQAVLVPVHAVPAALFLIPILYVAAITTLLTSWGLFLNALKYVLATIFAYIFLHLALDDLHKLRAQFKNFEVRETKCLCCTLEHENPETKRPIPCDRKLVYTALGKWFTTSGDEDEDAAPSDAYLDHFNSFIRENVSTSLTNRTFRPLALYKASLSLFVPGVWFSITMLAAGVHPLLALGNADFIVRWIARWVLKGFLYYPSTIMFFVRTLTLYNRYILRRCPQRFDRLAFVSLW